MSRLILLILIGLIANWWWRNLLRQRGSGSQPRRDAGARDAASARTTSPFSKGASRAPQAALPEPMVRCAFCDTHLPVSEATNSAGRHFCNPRHAHDYATRAAQQGDAR